MLRRLSSKLTLSGDSPGSRSSGFIPIATTILDSVPHRVLVDYRARTQDELSVARGEIVQVTQVLPTGWSMVTTPGDQMTGLVPSSHLEVAVSISPHKCMSMGRPAPPPPITREQILAAECNECSICFAEMPSAAPQCILLARGSTNQRTCEHFAHLACCEQLLLRKQNRCPTCNLPFYRLAAVPNMQQESKAWFRSIMFAEQRHLTKQEVLVALQTFCMDLDWREMHSRFDEFWPLWDVDNNDRLGYVDLFHPETGFVAHMQRTFCRLQLAVPPKLEVSTLAQWFAFWDHEQHGALTREELLRAVIKTMRDSDVEKIRLVVNGMWQAFDLQEEITQYEFVHARDGMGECLVANLHF